MTEILLQSFLICILTQGMEGTVYYIEIKTICETHVFTQAVPFVPEVHDKYPDVGPIVCDYTNAGRTNRERCTSLARAWTKWPSEWTGPSKLYKFVPEPVTPILLLAGVVGLGVLRRFRCHNKGCVDWGNVPDGSIVYCETMTIEKYQEALDLLSQPGTFPVYHLPSPSGSSSTVPRRKD